MKLYYKFPKSGGERDIETQIVLRTPKIYDQRKTTCDTL